MKAAAISAPWSWLEVSAKAYCRRCKRRSFSGSVADAIILGEHDPAALADFKQPIFVFRLRRKVVVVNLDGFTDFSQRLSNDLSAEGTVDEKD